MPAFSLLLFENTHPYISHMKLEVSNSGACSTLQTNTGDSWVRALPEGLMRASIALKYEHASTLY
jgi:hypothetical protein